MVKDLAVVGFMHLPCVPHMVQDLVHVRVSERHKLQNKKVGNQVSSLEIKYQVWKSSIKFGK